MKALQAAVAADEGVQLHWKARTNMVDENILRVVHGGFVETPAWVMRQTVEVSVCFCIGLPVKPEDQEVDIEVSEPGEGVKIVRKPFSEASEYEVQKIVTGMFGNLFEKLMLELSGGQENLEAFRSTAIQVAGALGEVNPNVSRFNYNRGYSDRYKQLDLFLNHADLKATFTMEMSEGDTFDRSTLPEIEGVTWGRAWHSVKDEYLLSEGPAYKYRASLNVIAPGTKWSGASNSFNSSYTLSAMLEHGGMPPLPNLASRFKSVDSPWKAKQPILDNLAFRSGYGVVKVVSGENALAVWHTCEERTREVQETVKVHQHIIRTVPKHAILLWPGTDNIRQNRGAICTGMLKAEGKAKNGYAIAPSYTDIRHQPYTGWIPNVKNFGSRLLPEWHAFGFTERSRYSNEGGKPQWTYLGRSNNRWELDMVASSDFSRCKKAVPKMMTMVMQEVTNNVTIHEKRWTLHLALAGHPDEVSFTGFWSKDAIAFGCYDMPKGVKIPPVKVPLDGRNPFAGARIAALELTDENGKPGAAKWLDYFTQHAKEFGVKLEELAAFHSGTASPAPAQDHFPPFTISKA